MGRLPTFLVIGAMKGGTTSLHRYLSGHPQVFMSRRKELDFFVTERTADGGRGKWQWGIGWYEQQFAEAPEEAIAIGEASASYSRCGQHPGVPERIAQVLPDVRLIYVLRHPVERMRSHYVHRVLRGAEKEPIERALLAYPPYLDTSCYARQLERYLEFFPIDRILAIRSEDLRAHRERTMRSVFAFVGVDADLTPSELDREFYRSADRRIFRPVASKLKRHRVMKSVIRYAPRPLREAGRRVATTNPRPDEFVIPAGLRSRLEDLLRPDVERLSKYLNESFDDWGLT